MKRTFLIAISLLVNFLVSERSGFACQICFSAHNALMVTSAKLLADYDLVLLGSWVKSQAANGETAGFTEFKIVRIGKDNRVLLHFSWLILNSRYFSTSLRLSKRETAPFFRLRINLVN